MVFIYRPFWLSPRQSIIVPVAPAFDEYAQKVGLWRWWLKLRLCPSCFKKIMCSSVWCCFNNILWYVSKLVCVDLCLLCSRLNTNWEPSFVLEGGGNLLICSCLRSFFFWNNVNYLFIYLFVCLFIIYLFILHIFRWRNRSMMQVSCVTMTWTLVPPWTRRFAMLSWTSTTSYLVSVHLMSSAQHLYKPFLYPCFSTRAYQIISFWVLYSKKLVHSFGSFIVSQCHCFA
jgi:hypothetical protein